MEVVLVLYNSADMLLISVNLEVTVVDIHITYLEKEWTSVCNVIFTNNIGTIQIHFNQSSNVFNEYMSSLVCLKTSHISHILTSSSD